MGRKRRKRYAEDVEVRNGEGDHCPHQLGGLCRLGGPRGIWDGVTAEIEFGNICRNAEEAIC